MDASIILNFNDSVLLKEHWLKQLTKAHKACGKLADILPETPENNELIMAIGHFLALTLGNVKKTANKKGGRRCLDKLQSKTRFR